MKIAILYIAVGSYSVFFKDFYTSALKHLFLNEEKHFFVFSDDENLMKQQDNHLHFFRVKNLGWPYNTLLRFSMFENILGQLDCFDYVYFFNANALFIADIDRELIPDKGNIVVAKHFKFMDVTDRYNYPLERNLKSTAFVDWGKEGKDYIQACFFGASKDEFVSLTTFLAKQIQNDLDNNVIAIWHDESHLNKYIINKDYTLLPVGYVYPESLNLNVEKRILMRDKEKYMVLSMLRSGKKENFLQSFRQKITNQLPKIKIVFAKIRRFIANGDKYEK